MFAGIASVGAALAAANLSWTLSLRVRMRRDQRRVCANVRDDAGQLIPLTTQNIRCAALVRAVNPAARWHLSLPHGQVLSRDEAWKAANRRGLAAAFEGNAQLTGATALRALATMLPQVNVHGGKKRVVRDAVDMVNASADAEHLLRETSARPRIREFGVREGETYVNALPPAIRLALEIMLHQDDERRAMDGELRELELRWRDADAIASIADSLTFARIPNQVVTASSNPSSVPPPTQAT
jgi:hypothetical protein